MNIGLILSGGIGTRLGLLKPKQYIEVESKPVIAYTIAVFEHHPQIDRIQIVADVSWHDTIMPWTEEKFFGFSKPGDNRQISILNGLRDILEYASDNDHVIIHDAVRPFVQEQTITECLRELEQHEGVLPSLPMKDTVYEGADGRIFSLLNRNRIVAGQAPEGFVIGKYYNANMALLPDKILEINGSSEPAILAGMDMVYIPGDEVNFKITTRADMEKFEQMVKGGNIS